MNEPFVFTTPEITMPKDNLHFGGGEHREVWYDYETFEQVKPSTKSVEVQTTLLKTPVLLREVTIVDNVVTIKDLKALVGKDWDVDVAAQKRL
ncbi:hypothetical protein BJ742DRAFT_771037 [Cladochytrium replicatum]|nr:hypothetical protein BJ742DRAFT_771037 [Cladochytrium replicatum]